VYFINMKEAYCKIRLLWLLDLALNSVEVGIQLEVDQRYR
jgi:hypothetical protein